MKGGLPWNKLRKLAAGLLAALMVLAIVYLRCGGSQTKEVRSGKLGYTTQAGWINWGHTNEIGTVRFLKEFRDAWHASGGRPFRVSYLQQMSGAYWVVRVQALLVREYQIESCPDDAALVKIALGIVRETSASFEAMQGEFPNTLDASSEESSFRDGDLRGNLISFYKALHGYRDEQIRAWLGAVSTEDSLSLLKDHPIGKSHSWNWPAAQAGGALDEIQHDPAWFIQHASLVREDRTWFRLSLP